jgi:hypothetical protein
MKKFEAVKIVQGIVSLRENATDATASISTTLYPSLRGDGSLIAAGTRIRWGGVLKRAAVDLWDTEQNTPDAAPALWGVFSR